MHRRWCTKFFPFLFFGRATTGLDIWSHQQTYISQNSVFSTLKKTLHRDRQMNTWCFPSHLSCLSWLHPHKKRLEWWFQPIRQGCFIQIFHDRYRHFWKWAHPDLPSHRLWTSPCRFFMENCCRKSILLYHIERHLSSILHKCFHRRIILCTCRLHCLSWIGR